MVELYTGLGYEINELLNLDGGGSRRYRLLADRSNGQINYLRLQA
jgi:hypothetical protein